MYNAEDFRVNARRGSSTYVQQQYEHGMTSGRVRPDVHYTSDFPPNFQQVRSRQQSFEVEAGRRIQVNPPMSANPQVQQYPIQHHVEVNRRPQSLLQPPITNPQPHYQQNLLEYQAQANRRPQSLLQPHQDAPVPHYQQNMLHYQAATQNHQSTQNNFPTYNVQAPTCTFGAPDCAGVCGGPSVRDCAGNCYNPTTGGKPTSVVDCAGVCGGKSELDCAGTCYDPTKGNPPHTKDCAGVCGGTSVPDCKGVCGGTSVADCKGVCGGTTTTDCAGVCGGPSTYDCKGTCYDPTKGSPPNTRDCSGACDGAAYLDCKGNCVTPQCAWDGKPVAYSQNTGFPVNAGRRRVQTFLPKNI